MLFGKWHVVMVDGVREAEWLLSDTMAQCSNVGWWVSQVYMYVAVLMMQPAIC